MRVNPAVLLLILLPLVADFERAAEMLGDSEPIVEPDGLPNAQGIQGSIS